MENLIGTSLGFLFGFLFWAFLVIGLSKISKKARNQIWPYWTGLSLTVFMGLLMGLNLPWQGLGSDFWIGYFSAFAIAVAFIVWRLVKQKNRIASAT